MTCIKGNKEHLQRCVVYVNVHCVSVTLTSTSIGSSPTHILALQLLKSRPNKQSREDSKDK